MALEIACAGCGKLLRVSVEHAGKNLRCPACNQVTTAPGPELAETTVLPAANWYMRTPEGQTYGPVTREELDRWILEGRLAADCQLANSAQGPWSGAASVFSALGGAPQYSSPQTSSRPSTSTFQGTPFKAASPFTDRLGGPQPARDFRHLQPHRGGLILVLGILGLVVNCPIFSFMAWAMGAADLREIQAGRMDPTGEGLTRAGHILGMILSILWIVTMMGVLLFFLIAMLANM
jgi:phage FluMu protein Com